MIFAIVPTDEHIFLLHKREEIVATLRHLSAMLHLSQKPRTGIHRLPLRDKRILLYGLLSEEIGEPIHLEAKSHRTATIRPTWKSKGVFAAFGRRRKTESQPLFIQLHEAGFGGILSEIRLFVAIGHAIGTNEINP